MKKNVAVIGSSGAIGNAISKILQNNESIETVYNFSRSTSIKSSKKEKNFFIDIENEDSIKRSVKNLSLIHI